jgi:hypothetical protein
LVEEAVGSMSVFGTNQSRPRWIMEV